METDSNDIRHSLLGIRYSLLRKENRLKSAAFGEGIGSVEHYKGGGKRAFGAGTSSLFEKGLWIIIPCCS